MEDWTYLLTPLVIPAKAGIHGFYAQALGSPMEPINPSDKHHCRELREFYTMGPRLRGDDGEEVSSYYRSLICFENQV